MENKQTQETDKEEIDLVDAIAILLKWKWLILAFALIAAIISLAIVSAAPTIYQADAIVEIGNLIVPNNDDCGDNCAIPIETALEVKEKIDDDIYGAAARQKNNIAEALTIKTSNTKGTNVINLSVQSADPGKAKNYLAAVCDQIVGEHKNRNDIRKTILENDISKTQEAISKLKSGGGQFQASGNDSYFQIAELEQQSSRDKLLVANFSDTAIIKQVSVSGPIDRKIMFKTLAAAVFGTIVAGFLIFAIEWWRKSWKNRGIR